MTLPIPPEVVYAGLGGTLLALVVATAQQKWQLRVFFLLALRLAIGWHFLFEGLHKIHSFAVGESETNKVFSSEPYFRASPTWFGAQMRKQFDDSGKTIAERVLQPKPIDKSAFAAMKAEEWAAVCPAAVAKELDDLEQKAAEAVRKAAEADVKNAPANYEKELKDIAAAEKKETDAAKDAAGKAAAKTKADAARAAAAKSRDETVADAGKRAESSAAAGRDLVLAAKAKYARWVYGAEGRETKVKYVTGPVSLTAPQRLDHIQKLRQESEAADQRRGVKLGTGNGIELKRAADLRAELVAAESELAKDALAFAAELRAEMGLKPAATAATAAADLASDDEKAREEAEGVLKGKLTESELKELREAAAVLKNPNSPEWEKRIAAQFTLNKLVREAEPKPTAMQDTVTAWFIAGVGACIMLGLFTRLSCVLAAGFLVTTYLTWPSYPWLPQPPNTEGNPLFVNKNIIECLALLSLACMPTGRWLGLDAIIYRIVTGKQD